MVGTSSPKERLQQLLSRFSSEDSVAVIINPDPDAIGSACALSRLLWRRVKRVGIFMVSPVRRPDNQSLIRHLRIHLRPLKELKTEHWNKLALVDNQPGHHEGFKGFSFNVIIDHHPKGASTSGAYEDIRPEYGATSTILFEYLRAARIKVTKRLATALFYGIKTDTKDLIVGGTERDINAFKELAGLSDMGVLKKIESSELTKKTLMIFKRAFENMRFLTNKIFVFMGNLKNADDLVIIADFFVKVADIDWAFVSGIVGNRLVVIIRYFGNKADAGKKAKALFEPLGASAGGHKSAARAEIEMKALERHLGPKEDLEGFLIKTIKKGRPPKG